MTGSLFDGAQAASARGASDSAPQGEPGSPLLSIDAPGPLETFADADALARRVHELRDGVGLDVSAGHAAMGGPSDFPGVLIWRAPRDGQRTFLAFAAGPGVRSPAELLAALGRTRAAPVAA